MSSQKTFLLVLLTYYCICTKSAQTNDNTSTFQVEYQWTFINFTWENEKTYQDAIGTGKYVPENSAITGFKFYEDKLFISIPRIRDGTPVTLGYVSTNEDASRVNPLITPFPDWETNFLDGDDCSKLISVVSMEIDPDGIMWVIDGHRSRSIALCPPKLILYDLDRGEIVQSYVFSNDTSLTIGGYLNDIVIDVDGEYAYITDHSNIDPGLVVYSKKENRSWKLRDPSMFGETNAAHFTVADMRSDGLSPLDGIALTPASNSGPRYVYFSAVTSYSLYAIDTSTVKNESLFSTGTWRYNVIYVGKKQAQSDGMLFDNEGTLYYGLLPLFGVAKWTTEEDLSHAEIVDINNATMIWTDGFAFDDQGYLYLLSNHILHFSNANTQLEVTDEPVFRLMRIFTGKNSYLY